jgi:hypothetical protein
MKLEMGGVTPTQIKILLFILIVAVLGLPYYLVVMPSMQTADGLKESIASLTDEKNQREEERSHEPDYIAGIAAAEARVNEILKNYPRALPQERSILFVVETEEFINDLRLESIGFGGGGEVPLAGMQYDEAGNLIVDENSIAVTSMTTTHTSIGDLLVATQVDLGISYSISYTEFKEFMRYILQYPERRVITSINLGFDPSTQKVAGGLSLSTYAINGPNRPPVVIEEPDFELGTRNIFLQARGLYYVADDEWLFPDFFIRFNLQEDPADSADDSITIGREASTASQLTAKLDEADAVTVTFTGMDNVYTAYYSVGNQVYEGDTYLFMKDDYLNIDLRSDGRFSGRRTPMPINVINQTDLPVNVTVFGDPDDALFSVQTTGDVWVRHWADDTIPVFN